MTVDTQVTWRFSLAEEDQNDWSKRKGVFIQNWGFDPVRTGITFDMETQ